MRDAFLSRQGRVKMEQAITENTFIDVGGAVAGISLGFCPGDAHDQGFDALMDALGVDFSAPGLERLNLRVREEDFHFRRFGKTAVLGFFPGWADDRVTETIVSLVDGCCPAPGELMSFWEEDAFLVASREQGADWLETLATSFRRGEMSLALPSGSCFNAPFPAFVRTPFVDPQWSKRLA